MSVLLNFVLEDAIDDMVDDVIDSGEVEIIDDEEDGIFAHPQMQEEEPEEYEDPYIQDNYSDDENEEDEYVEYPVQATDDDNDLDTIIDQLDGQIEGEDDDEYEEDDSDDEEDIFVEESAKINSEGSLYTLEDSSYAFYEYEKFINESFLLNNSIQISESVITEGFLETAVTKIRKIIEWLWDKIVKLVTTIKEKILGFVTGQTKFTELVKKFRAERINPDEIPNPEDITAEESALFEATGGILTQNLYHVRVNPENRAAAFSYIDKALNFNVNSVNTPAPDPNIPWYLQVREIVKTNCGFNAAMNLNYEPAAVGTEVSYEVKQNNNESGIYVVNKQYTSVNEAKSKPNPQQNNGITKNIYGVQQSFPIEYIIHNTWFAPGSQIEVPFRTMLISKNEICDQYVSLMRFISDAFKDANNRFKKKKEEYSKNIKKLEEDIKSYAKDTAKGREIKIPIDGSNGYQSIAVDDTQEFTNGKYLDLQILREAANVHTFIIESELNAINRCILTEYKYVRNTLVDLMTFSGFGAKYKIKINSLILRDTPVGASTKMDPMYVNYKVLPTVTRRDFKG